MIPGLDSRPLSAKKLKHIRRRSYQLEKSFTDDVENDGTKKHEGAKSTTPETKSVSQNKQEATKTAETKTIPDLDQLWKDCLAGSRSVFDSGKKGRTRRSGEKRSLLTLQASRNNDQTSLIHTSNYQNNNNSKTPENKILNQATSVGSLMKTVDELLIPRGSRKSVTFGPHLSPELFNKKNPTDTPLRRGAKPIFTPLPSASKSKSKKRRASILKTPNIIGHSKQNNDLSDVVSNLNFASNDLLSLQELENTGTSSESETLTTASHQSHNDFIHGNESNDDLISIDPILNLSVSPKNATTTNVKRRSFQSNSITRRHSSGTVQQEKSNKNKNLKRHSNDWVFTLGDRRSDDVLLTEIALKNKNKKRRSSQRRRSSQNTCNDGDGDINTRRSIPTVRVFNSLVSQFLYYISDLYYKLICKLKVNTKLDF